MISAAMKKLLGELDMSLQELADKAGVPLETIRNIYYGKVTDPKVSTMMSISEVLQVSVNYLMGKGLYSPEEQLLVRTYRKCGVHGKSIVNLVAKYEANISQIERESREKHKIPCLVPMKIKDGFNYVNNDVAEVETTEKEAYTAIKISSHAFAPVFCKGDIVLIADRFPEEGEKGVFVLEGKGYIRQFVETETGYTLKSLNGREKDIHLKRLDSVVCIGTCTGAVLT